MKWVMNDYKFFVPEIGGMTESEWIKWQSGFIIGEPLPFTGSSDTVEKLKEEGLVGLYK